MKDLSCFNCGASLADEPLPISRQATCRSCFYELHCCRMCRHFDPANATRCHEDRAETPIEKEVANFCEYFDPAAGRGPAGGNTDTGMDKAQQARQQLDDLFKPSS
ncbi:MAG: hypothetical protein ACFHXK_16880 [bacterium]